jgi:hypothetical protein
MIRHLLILLCCLACPLSNVWSQTFIPANPNVTDEGIWFVIQNKSGTDNDILTIPADRVALKINSSGNAEMAQIPMDNAINYDEFLWRTVHLPGGKYKLINKKEGETKALSVVSNAMSIASIANVSNQEWIMEYSSVTLHGTNVYTLSNSAMLADNVFRQNNSSISVASKNTSDVTQCWVLLPMDLVTGYAFPVAATSDHYRKLELPFGYTQFASHTVSNWAILHTHLIYKNMFNALLPVQVAKMTANTDNKQVVIVSKDDPNTITAATPYLYPRVQSTWMTQFRGGVFPGSTHLVLITEEMMNKVGVYTRGASDKAYREYEQVVHEMAHSIDVICNLQTSQHVRANGSAEWFAGITQGWFNSLHSDGAGYHRGRHVIDDKNYLVTVFNELNTWQPPRNLRGDDPTTLPPCAASSILYVDAGKAATGDGNSWNTAFKTLEEALALAHTCNVSEIRVAGGTYYPGNTHGSADPRDATFAIMRSKLRITGGYNPATGQRSPATHPSVLSGDIGTLNNSSDNSYHVVIMGAIQNHAVDKTILDGFIITKGNANGSGELNINHTVFYKNNGGGIHLISTADNAIIQNCFITGNHGNDGGAISGQYGSSTIINCVIAGNTANFGSAVLNYASSPKIINTTIAANVSAGGGSVIHNITRNTTPAVASVATITNSIIWGNNSSFISEASPSGSVVNNSIIQGGSYAGTGNLSTNPDFADLANPIGPDNIWGTEDDGLRVRANSAAIDAGNNTPITGTPLDMAGAVRIQNSTVDMGAYEGGVICAPAIIYVNAAISTSGNGHRWNTAFKTLEEALTLANTCNMVKEIRVAGGTYYPGNTFGSSNPRMATFAFTRAGLKVLGGYNAATGVRNTSQNPTILSGDIGTLNNNSDNSYHVAVIGGIPSSATDSTIIDGFIITQGNANGSDPLNINGTPFYQNNGGGIHINNVSSNSVIRNCFIVENNGNDGGGFSIHNATPTVINTVIANNVAGYGGGTLLYNAAATFINCTVSGNQGNGAGFSNLVPATPATLINVIDWGNAANLSSSGYNVTYSTIQGSGVYAGTANTNSNPNFVNSGNAKGADNIWGTADDGLILQVGSPAINTGNNAVSLGTTMDVSGKTRFQNTTIDKGAYEYQASPVIPALPTANDPQIFCGAATVGDLAATGTNLQWYVASSGGAPLATTTSLSNSTYYVSQTVNGYESSRKATAVTVNASPNAPTASSQALCANSTVSNLVASGTGLKWYDVATDGTALAPASIVATGTYYVSQTVNTCESGRTAVSVTINNTAKPVANAQALIPGSTVADLQATGANLKWYANSSGGAALLNTTALVAGTYYVSQTLNGCESERQAVTITLQYITTRYVKPVATGTGDGASWANASADLQAMINAAGVEQVWVAGGIYKPQVHPNTLPATRVNRDKAFLLKEHVKVYGGFAGTETSLAQRNLSLTANKSVLSGDFNGDDTVAGSGATLTMTNYSENAFHIVICAGEMGTAVLDGFTITGGAADTTVNRNVAVNGKQISSQRGGGIYLIDASPRLSNLIIEYNIASAEGGGVNVASSSAVLQNVSVNTNRGGAIMIRNGANTYHMKADRLTIRGNYGTIGGIGLIVGTVTLTNSLIIKNAAPATSGALNVSVGNYVLINTTISDNRSGAGNANVVYAISNSSLTIINSIINNSVTLQSGSTAQRQNSLAQSFSGVNTNNGTNTNNIPGNTNPLFVDSAANNYRLQDCSPLINAGDNSLLPDSLQYDHAGNNRWYRNGRVDIGAFEKSTHVLPDVILNDSTSNTQVQPSSGTQDYFGSCNQILASVTGDGSSSTVSGNVKVTVWLSNRQLVDHVRRYYQIMPAVNAGSATGRVTLYYTQADFDAFNNVNSRKLPQHPSDNAGKANLIVEKISGTSNDNSGKPGSYHGVSSNIHPASNDIVWNAQENYWEVSFSVTGFSGFFIKTVSVPLPLDILEFKANATANCKVNTYLMVAKPEEMSYFDIEHSNDGYNFKTAQRVDAVSTQQSYTTFIDIEHKTTFIRAKAVSNDGKAKYSKVEKVISFCDPDNIVCYPNPVTSQITVGGLQADSRYMIYNGMGQLIQSGNISPTEATIILKNIPAGNYQLILQNQDGATQKKSFPFVKS